MESNNKLKKDLYKTLHLLRKEADSVPVNSTEFLELSDKIKSAQRKIKAVYSVEQLSDIDILRIFMDRMGVDIPIGVEAQFDDGIESEDGRFRIDGFYSTQTEIEVDEDGRIVKFEIMCYP